MDTANVGFVDVDFENRSNPLRLLGSSSNCYHCLPTLIFDNLNSSVKYSPIETRFEYQFILQSQSENASHFLKSFSTNELGDRGVYLYSFSGSSSDLKSDLKLIEKPYNTWLPVFLAICVYVAIAFVLTAGIYVWRWTERPLLESDLERAALNRVPDQFQRPQQKDQRGSSIKPRGKNRLGSLDCIRGISIVVMIFVNYGGGGYWFFDHSVWNGLTFADLVFPWFIWIMGTAMAFSFQSLQNSGKLYSGSTLWKITKRSIILFALGMFLNNGYNLSHWRILGVLQRFGVTYGVTAAIALLIPKLCFSQRKWLSVNAAGDFRDNPHHNRFRIIFQDIFPYLLQWIVVGLILTTYLLFTFLLDVPNCGRGYLGPGGIGDSGKFENCTGGAAGYIDKLILGEKRLYQTPTCKTTYLTGPYDPEGILGYLTSIVLCFIGLQAGRTLVCFQNHSPRIARFLIWGIVFGLLGLFLCNFHQNGGWIPICKNLWSPSYIFVMAGTAFLLLAFCYILIDVVHWWNGAPFHYVGMNSILIYMAHEILQIYFPFSTYVPNTHAAQLAQNLFGLTCWLIIAYKMYRNRFFVNI